MGKTRNPKKVGNLESHSLSPLCLSPSPSSLLPPPLSPKNVPTRVDSFRKLFGFNKMDPHALENQENNAVVEEEAPPSSGSASPVPDEDLDSMTMDEVLRAMKLLKVFANMSDKEQKKMKVRIDDQATAIGSQKSTTDLLTTQVEGLRSNLLAVKDLLA